MIIWFMVAAGGALGALSRYAIDEVFRSIMGPTVIGTFAANISGSFLLGLIAAISSQRSGWGPEIWAFTAIGFLGAYTTFSTLTVTSVQIMSSGDAFRAATNIAGSVAVGLLAAGIGIFIGRMI